MAIRFRTTVRALLRLNPDVGADLALQRARLNDKICIIPCAVSGPVCTQPQHAIPGRRYSSVADLRGSFCTTRCCSDSAGSIGTRCAFSRAKLAWRWGVVRPFLTWRHCEHHRGYRTARCTSGARFGGVQGSCGGFPAEGAYPWSLEECMVVATLNVVPLWTLREDPGFVSHVMIKQTTCGGAIVRRVCI